MSLLISTIFCHLELLLIGNTFQPQTVASLKASCEKLVICTQDIANAYDCVHLKTLHQVMLDCNIAADFLNWTIDNLSDRTLYLAENTANVYNGLPQGSCLSAFFSTCILQNFMSLKTTSWFWPMQNVSIQQRILNRKTTKRR